jgi:hypothetical protein
VTWSTNADSQAEAISIATYARLLIPDLLPNTIERVLYLVGKTVLIIFSAADERQSFDSAVQQIKTRLPDYECSTAAKCGTYRLLFSIPVL